MYSIPKFRTGVNWGPNRYDRERDNEQKQKQNHTIDKYSDGTLFLKWTKIILNA